MNSIVELDKHETVDLWLEAIRRLANDEPTDIEFEHDSTPLIGFLAGMTLRSGEGMRLQVEVWDMDNPQHNGGYSIEHSQLLSLQDA
jgi:hypothetical protein